MNRIVLIGNGFDLTHGLKTQYKDFIDWYWKQRIVRLFNEYTSVSKDPLCTFIIKNHNSSWNGFFYQLLGFNKEPYRTLALTCSLIISITCKPILPSSNKILLWMLKFEFHIILMCLLNKPILNLQAMQSRKNSRKTIMNKINFF